MDKHAGLRWLSNGACCSFTFSFREELVLNKGIMERISKFKVLNPKRNSKTLLKLTPQKSCDCGLEDRQLSSEVM